MHFFRFCSACALALALGNTASGQIYESKDAEGNTVFSDRPSQGSKVIEVTPTNSADPVAEIPRPPPSAPADTPRQGATRPAGSTQQPTDNGDDYIYYGGGTVNKEEAQERLEEAKRLREEGAENPGREPPARVEPYAKPARPAAGGGGGRR